MTRPAKVYALNKAFQSNLTGDKWNPTGGSLGTLYMTLESAQAQVSGAGEWKKDDRRRTWRTDHNDIISEITVKP